MRSNPSASISETPTAALVRETASAVVKTLLAELRHSPLIQPEYFSLQAAAIYCGYSEHQFAEFVRLGTAPPSVKFSRSARRFKRSDLDSWAAAGGPSQFQRGGKGAVQK